MQGNDAGHVECLGKSISTKFKASVLVVSRTHAEQHLTVFGTWKTIGGKTDWILTPVITGVEPDDAAKLIRDTTSPGCWFSLRFHLSFVRAPLNGYLFPPVSIGDLALTP